MYIVKVWKHKTLGPHGAAQVNMGKEEFTYLKTIVEVARPKLPMIKSDHVFLAWTGQKMKPGQISDRINFRFVQAGIIDPATCAKRLCLNIIRKSTSSGIRESCENSKTDHKAVATQMMHSTRTQAANYWLVQKEQQSIAGSKAIRKYYSSATITAPLTDSATDNAPLTCSGDNPELGIDFDIDGDENGSKKKGLNIVHREITLYKIPSSFCCNILR